VTDMTRTKGHVSSMTAVQWHPFERDIIFTSSQDGSVRIWNLRKGKLTFDKKLTCSSVYKMKNSAGQRTPATALAFHPGGREFGVGTACGSVQIWSSMGVRLRPERAVYKAHSDPTGKTAPAINSILFSPDGTLLASRAGGSEELDDTVRVWSVADLGKNGSSSPLFVCKDVPSFSEHANCAFSPNSRMLIVGTYMNRNKGNPQGDGVLKVFRIPKENDQSHYSNAAMEVPALLQLPVTQGSCMVRVFWHSKLNQVVCGSADGR